MNARTHDAFAADHAAWHADVEAARRAPYGPLSPIAMHWLTAEPQSLPEAPGRWSVDADGHVTVELSASDGVTTLDGAPLVAAAEGADRRPNSDAVTVHLGPLTGTASLLLVWGERRIEVAARSGSVIVRPRDPASPDRTGYLGTATFPPSEAWVVTARFVPAPVSAVEVASAAGEDRRQQYDSPGSAEFEVDGHTVSLVLFGSRENDDLRAVFSDTTGQDLTFPASRFVDAAQTDDHTVVIDFNRTINPPCAYSMSATCPFPPPGNRLPVRITAGELRPGVAAPSTD